MSHHGKPIDNVILPTLSSPTWTITSLFDSLKQVLPADKNGKHLRLLFYAVSLRGWNTLRATVKQWLDMGDRQCTAYIGTDHGITDPDALEQMQKTVAVRLLLEYRGVYHPKIVWSEGALHSLWIGSNNLTEGGFQQNIECAVHIESPELPDTFSRWFKAVHAASELATAALISDYRVERDKFAKDHLSEGAFTWSKRREPLAPPPQPPIVPTTRVPPKGEERLAPAGSLIVQVMPRETGPGGKQLQLPMASVATFFGLDDTSGSSRVLQVRSTATDESRTLTMTVYGNRTVRLSISELDYSDRPCVIVFTPSGRNRYDFEIIQKAVWPGRFRKLIEACNHPTRLGSRRWAIK